MTTDQQWLKIEEAKQKALFYKGGKCVDCGSVDRLHFHHLRDKKYNISDMYFKGFEYIKEELDKCDLLCIHCHNKRHYSGKTHGKISTYNSGCRCIYCKNSNSLKSRKWRRRK